MVPVDAGSPGTRTGMAVMSTNAITVSVVGTRWTTGSIVANDQTASAPTATASTVLSAAGSNGLGPSGGSITLVTPILIRFRSAGQGNSAGYAVLSLNFSSVPEPGTLLLLGCAAALGVRRVYSRRR